MRPCGACGAGEIRWYRVAVEGYVCEQVRDCEQCSRVAVVARCRESVFGGLSPDAERAARQAAALWAKVDAEAAEWEDRPAQRAIERVAQRVLDADGHASGLLVGSVGGGKSMRARAVAAELARRGIDARYLPEAVLIKAQDAETAGERAWRTALWDQAASCTLLVLDELGNRADVTEAYRGRVDELLDARDRQGLHVLATSNAAPDKLRIARGERFVSRLIGMCGRAGVAEVRDQDQRLARGRAT